MSLRVDKTNHIDLTSDGFIPYINTVTKEFSECASYAQLVKNFQMMKKKERMATNTPTVYKNILFGERQNQSISTSYVERLNLSVRTFTKRFTRRSICYSKKLENLKHSVALFAAHYNFCRIHSTIKTTPAVFHGVVDNVFTIEQLLGF